MDCEHLITELQTLANRHCGTLHTTCKESAEALAALRSEVEQLREATLAAYRKGHHHTVNGGYQWCDQGGREVVEEIIREVGGEE